MKQLSGYLGLSFCLAAGCAGPVDLFDPIAQSGEPPSAYSDRDWATVLRENVKNDLVDYEHLGEHAQPLEHYLALVAAVGPESTPELFDGRDAMLAYYLNVYNAGVLAAVLHEHAPATMHEVGRRQIEDGYRLLIDRNVRTLGDVRQAARERSAGDVRIELCLCDAARGSPPLPDAPFRPETLDGELREVARRAMGNPRLVSVDHEHERLNVAVAIHQRRARFLDYLRRQTGARSTRLLGVLLHMADGVRREWLNTAVGYEEGVIPFDRSLNRWSRQDKAADEPRTSVRADFHARGGVIYVRRSARVKARGASGLRPPVRQRPVSFDKESVHSCGRTGWQSRQSTGSSLSRRAHSARTA